MFQDASISPGVRVALVTGGLPLGGSTTFLCNLAGELVRRGISAEVLSFEHANPLASDFRRLNIPVLCLDDRRFIFEDRMQAVLRRLGEFKPTVVVANLATTSFEVLRYVPPGVFRIGVSHSDHSMIYKMIPQYATFLDLLAVVSEKIKRKFQETSGMACVPVRYLPLGVPISDTSSEIKNFNQPVRILYLGRLTRDAKRVNLFPAIFNQLQSSGIPFHWTIAGEGIEKEFLGQTMKSSGTQTVSFPGPIPYQDVERLLPEHDIFLLVSDYEGLPLSLLEAMGHGLVPVVSDLESGIRDVVDVTNGVLVPVNDVEGYGRAIIHLHEHRDELAAKSAAARARVQKEFSVGAMTDRWLAAFPKEPPVIGAWPANWRIKPIVAARYPVYYSPPVRILRRLAARFRH